MTQSDMVLRHMKIYGSITPREALDQYAIMRLGARIYDLKRMGYKIITMNIKTENRFGDPVHFARYILDESQASEAKEENV